MVHGGTKYRDKLLPCGWWTLNREKIRESSAEYWVLVLQSYLGKTKDNGSGQEYWEIRGLNKAETDALVRGDESIALERDFCRF